MPLTASFYTMNVCLANTKVAFGNRYIRAGGLLAALAALLFVGFAIPAHADIITSLSDNFDSYSNGNLNGQGFWVDNDSLASGLNQIDDDDFGKTVKNLNSGGLGRSKLQWSTSSIDIYSNISVSYIVKWENTSAVLPNSGDDSFLAFKNGGNATLCSLGFRDGDLKSLTQGTGGDFNFNTSPALNTWYTMSIEFDLQNDRCRYRVNASTSAWATITDVSNSFPNLMDINIDGSSSADYGFFDQLIFYNTGLDGQSSSLSGTSNTSRIISTWPNNESLTPYATGTISYASTTYYINSDDICSILCTTRFEYTYQYIGSDGSVEFTEIPTATEVTTTDTIVTVVTPLNRVSGLGTYPVSIRVYNDRLFGFLDSDITQIYTTSFTIATRTVTDLSQIERNESLIAQAFAGITCEFSFPFLSVEDATCLGQYLLAIFVPPLATLQDQFTQTVSTFLYVPPWGYVSVLNESLLNPATTATSSTQISFTPQVGMPGYGQSLTLDVADGFTLFQSTLSGTSTSFVGSYYDQFIYYWELIWYLAFGLWLVWNLLGIMAPQQQQSQSTRSEILAKKYTLDLRK